MPHGDTPLQYFRRLTDPAFTPLDGPSIYAAWRASVYPAWWGQYLHRLAGPVFTPLGACWLLLKKRRLDAGGVCGR